MKQLKTIVRLMVICLLASCSDNDLKEKGFSVSPVAEDDEENKNKGLSKDSLILETKPSSVLLTGDPQYRLTTVYKVNDNKKKTKTFIGSNRYYRNYDDLGTAYGNRWNYNFMPGLEAVSGYNMVNISHYDIATDRQKNFFEKPVLVRTLYYPSFSKDTLNFKPVNRDYFMTSVYDDDTNKDGFINLKDLRRFYLFDINGNRQKPLVPTNYSVFKSEYDPANDLMYVFAQLDENNNGQRDRAEATHVFWIDLKDPHTTGRLY